MIKLRRIKNARHDDFRRLLFGMTSIEANEHYGIKYALLRRSLSLRCIVLAHASGDERIDQLTAALDDAIYLLMDKSVQPLAHKPEVILRLMEAVLGMITASARLSEVVYHKYYAQIFTLGIGLFTSSHKIDRAKYYHEYASYLLHYHFLNWYVQLASKIVRGEHTLPISDPLYTHVFAWDKHIGRLGYIRGQAKVYAADFMSALVLIDGDPLTTAAQALGWMKPHGLAEAAARQDDVVAAEGGLAGKPQSLSDLRRQQAVAAIRAAKEKDGPEGITEDEQMVLAAHEGRRAVNGENRRVKVMVGSASAIGHDKEKRQDLYKLLEYFAEEPQTISGNISDLVVHLAASSPWVREIIDFADEQQKIVRLSKGGFMRLPPVLLVGPPGSGKTALVKVIAKAAGLPLDIISASGSADSRDLAGTSAGWSSASPSRPVLTIAKYKVANPMIVVDEVDKIGGGKHNGSMSDTLLTMIEKETASRYYDEALRATFDLSRISWVMTANDLEGIPAPLRSRLRIVRVGRPGTEHADVAINALLQGILEDRGIPGGAAPAIREDVLSVIRAGFRRPAGADLRRVKAALERALALELADLTMH